MKHYTMEEVKEALKKINLLDFLKYTCINAAYSDFANKFMRAIDSVALIKKVRVKANASPCLNQK